MLLFFEVLLNLLNKVSAITVTFACDYLNVLRIYAQSIHINCYKDNQIFRQVKVCLLALLCKSGNVGSSYFTTIPGVFIFETWFEF